MGSIDPTNDPTPTEAYVIQLRGELDSHWRAWFEGMTITQPGDGTTVITGQITDQSALHGVLQRVRDLGLPLVSVRRLGAEDRATVPPAPNQPEEGIQP